jgi:hypothetical protein
MSRTTIFLSVLSAAIVSLALLANATGFGPGVGRRFLANTPTVVGTVDAAIAAAIVVLAVRTAEATMTRPSRRDDGVPGRVDGAVRLERHALDPLRRTTPRFPTPPDES